MKYVLLLFAFILLGCKEDVSADMKHFLSADVLIPKHKMINCSDSVDLGIDEQNYIYIVNYIEEYGCSKCKLSTMSELYRNNIQSKGTILLSIIQSEKTKIEETHNIAKPIGLCGYVYLDTCNAFLEANPQIPDNELFHTFVINNEGKVLMVGNPFQNEKMEALFKKVIANEQKKQKKKRPA